MFCSCQPSGADPELDYVAAVQAFVKASQPLFGPSRKAAAVEKPSLRGELQRLHQEETLLCIERRNSRKRRELEDAAWRMTWHQHRTENTSTEEIAKPKLRAR